MKHQKWTWKWIYFITVLYYNWLLYLKYVDYQVQKVATEKWTNYTRRHKCQICTLSKIFTIINNFVGHKNRVDTCDVRILMYLTIYLLHLCFAVTFKFSLIMIKTCCALVFFLILKLHQTFKYGLPLKFQPLKFLEYNSSFYLF